MDSGIHKYEFKKKVSWTAKMDIPVVSALAALPQHPS